MSSETRRVTAMDVARAAGVSKTTVSYVLNETPHQKIPEETKERVYAAVRELKYVPSAFARALRTGRTDTVLLVLPDWPLGRVLARIIDALTTELDAHGLSLVTRRERADQPLSSLARELAPAAVISFHDVDPVEEELLESAGVHVATALMASDRSPGQAFVLPQELIGALQVQHLARTGHRHIGYAALENDRVELLQQLRLRGARRACMELGLDDPLVVRIDLTLEEATAAIQQWRRADPRVTGIAGFNDEVAAALLSAAHGSDLVVPTDLAVVGVDDEPLSRFAYPPLTTVKQDEQKIATHLAQTVLDGIAGRAVRRPVSSDAIQLVVRESA